MTFRSILVPTDFSPQATAALEAATDLARRFESSITLLHVYAVPGLLMPDGFVAATPDALRELLDAVERSLKELRARTEAPGRTVETIARQGGAHHEIVEVARERGHDLIVIGTHGRTGVARFLIGSVAERVVRDAPCPVLVVRPQGG